ncbi:MAG: DUF1836 domain-containing protein [Eubacteriales bacterium]|nr:DUF1836 domain-containing protein [Eubacteriales bacterium]MDD3200276.1 DUF1836 domain-containing protein [Eubacteriales bacterium]MDD4121964.1 DUF1836 domain-containing protein [Eubacteriales bacterium]MDD4630245.1 DUF1836 domain-containing protein [Eubacteriales bacterium]
MRYEEFIKGIVEKFVSKGLVDADSFPDMEIYMDQAETFMNRELEIFKQNDKDKVITKTMIGNYVKHNMLPRPVNKKYSKDHLILLTLIFYLKGIFQMEEIENILKPLIDNYNSVFDDKVDLTALYEGILSAQAEELQSLTDNISSMVESSKHQMREKELSDDDMLEMFMLIVSLSMKANAQKFLAHKLLQEYILKPKQKN